MRRSLSSIFYLTLTGMNSTNQKSEGGGVITLSVQKGGSEVPSLIKRMGGWKKEIKKKLV